MRRKELHVGIWLVLILGAGLFFRLWGISWGLPDRLDFHPDEHDYVMKHALQLSWENPDPGFLNYPGFLMYLIALTFGGLKHLGLIVGETWQAYFIGRMWSACSATAIVLPVYALARELGGSFRAALLAALWAALLPLTTWEGHVAITDTLMTFWTTMTLWASVRLVRTNRLRDYALAGACLGLATGSKYTAAMAVVAVVTGALVSRRPWRAVLCGLVIAGMTALACAFVVMPYSFIRFDDLLSAMKFEHEHTHSHHFGFSLPAAGWQYHRYLYQLVAAFPFSLGIVLYASAAAGTIWALLRFDRRQLPIIAFLGLFFGVTAHWYFVPIRYYTPLLVIGVLWAGLWHGALLDSADKRIRIAGFIIAAATFAYTLVFTGQTVARYASETRAQADAWLDANLRPGGSMLVGGWSRYCAMPTVRTNYVIDGGRDESLLRKMGDSPPYDLIQITSLHYDRHFRDGEPGWVNAYRHIRDPNGPFERVAKFESRFINKRFYKKLDPMYGGYFISPTLEFYRARNPRPASTNGASGSVAEPAAASSG